MELVSLTAAGMLLLGFVMGWRLSKDFGNPPEMVRLQSEVQRLTGHVQELRLAGETLEAEEIVFDGEGGYRVERRA